MVPITGAAHLLQLALDDVMVLILNGPGALKELLTSKILTSEAFLGKLSLNYVLCGDTSMVCSGNPKSGDSCHSLISDDDVLKAVVKGMAHVEDTCYVWWRHDYSEMPFTILWGKLPLLLPLAIYAVLKILRIIGFCQFHGFHTIKDPPLLSWMMLPKNTLLNNGRGYL